MLSKNQLKKIVGKGQNGLEIHPVCADGDWAPPGASQATYPNFPCAHTIVGPIVGDTRICAEPGKDGIIPIC
ncbi:hypothetical protein QWY99_07430 [Flavobacterium branchiarum]|uniref:Uncharacterized protein n=1 Tax=Flavobacterium branchiarum TaxID=1114870 RepID=A0ABV5FGC0_9FLAO|nr:hypothetical protein [Flavobacterium branchiarum]MDN3672881.1 hypothetical protein [Flavobacterium branchiarum]